MSILTSSNFTVNLYRSGNHPPAVPDLQVIALQFKACYAQGLGQTAGDASAKKYSHIMEVANSADIRDAWSADTVGIDADVIYLGSTGFKVVFVELISAGAAQLKRVYLSRQRPSWPSTDL